MLTIFEIVFKENNMILSFKNLSIRIPFHLTLRLRLLVN